MTKQETTKALAVIQEIYPRFMDGRNPQTTTEIWARLFQAEPYAKVEAAVLAFAASDTKGFAPNVGQIKEQLALMDQKDEPDEQAAWALVMQALRNGYYGAEKEFAALPEAIRRCVGNPMQLREWAMMDTEVLSSVVASNFMRTWRVRAHHVRELQKLPDNIRALYIAAGEAFAMDRHSVCDGAAGGAKRLTAGGE